MKWENDTFALVKKWYNKRIKRFIMSRYQESRESHLKLVQFIEKATMESAPDVIITHHPADTNNDHLQISMACQEAIQLQQARGEANQGILVYGGA